MYSKVKDIIIDELKETESVALTNDSWTSRTCESYVTITVHFMQSDWNMKSYVLQTRDVSHPGQNIGNVLMESITEWKLPTKHEIGLVTDHASNMEIAAKAADLHPHMGCFAHTVNLACHRGLKVSALGRLHGRIYPMKAVVLENMAENVQDSNLVREVKQAKRENLSKRYTEEDTAEFLLLCAALYPPRFKCLPGLEQNERDEVYGNIERKVLF